MEFKSGMTRMNSDLQTQHINMNLLLSHMEISVAEKTATTLQELKNTESATVSQLKGIACRRLIIQITVTCWTKRNLMTSSLKKKSIKTPNINKYKGI
jgi:hypothetical protein